MPRSRRRDDDDDDDDRPRRKTRRDRDDDDEEEDEDDTPRRKRSRSIADDDDEDEDDRPRKRSRSIADDDDDDEDEDDRPRKRKPLKRSKKKAGGNGPLLLILGLAGVFVLLAGGGFAVWFFVFNDTPEKAFEDFRDATVKRDYGRIWDRMDKQGQQKTEDAMRGLVTLDRSLAVHSDKKGKELYVAVSKDTENHPLFGRVNDKMRDEARDAKLDKVTVSGDTATLSVKGANGRTETLTMVKQDGRWRVSPKR